MQHFRYLTMAGYLVFDDSSIRYLTVAGLGTYILDDGCNNGFLFIHKYSAIFTLL